MGTTEASTAGRLVSRTELADLAGVRRPTVTTWAKRHRNFPKPVHSGDRDYFPLASAIAWLDHRQIPAKDRSAYEPPGFTYGERVRRRSSDAGRHNPGHRSSSADAGSQSALDQLLGTLAGRIRNGGGSQADYLTLLICLIFLRGRAVQYWSELRRIATAVPTQIRPEQLVQRIGELTDQALRLHGIVPGIRLTLERLRPRSVGDIAEIVRLCGELNTDAFGLLAARFAAEAKLTSADFFTPGDVALLTARVATADSSTELPIYDPYLRGGELLQAASLIRPISDPLLLQGETPNRETLRIAGMNLALHGRPATLRLGSSTPWDDLDKPSPMAAVVIINPPFNSRTVLSRNRPDSGWLFASPPPHNDNYAWLQYAIASLSLDGTAAVLMANQALVTLDEREHRIRKEMVERGAVVAIIALPPSLFPSTDVAVTIWVLRRPGDKPDRILFVDARKMSRKTSNGHSLSPDADQLISGLYKRRNLLAEGKPQRLAGGGIAVSADIEALRRTNYSLNPPDYMPGSIEIAVHTPSDEASDILQRLAGHNARVNQLDSQVDKLSTLRREGFCGDLPSNWTRAPLHGLCEIQAGPSYTRLGRTDRVKDGSVPIVMPRHLRHRRVVAPDAEKTTDEVASRLAKFQLSTNDILAVRSGTMTEPALVERQQEGWLFGSNLLRLRLFDLNAVTPSYLLGFLALPAVLAWIRNQSRGSLIPFITVRDLGQLVVPLPSIPEQHDIGSALLAFDEQIIGHQDFAGAATKARTALAEQLMQGALVLR